MSNNDRKKQIDIIARSFSMQSHAGDPRSFSEGIELGFKAGAAWADRNPANKWHDASEEPKRNEYLLGEDNDGFSIYMWRRQEDGWNLFVGITTLRRWAYIEDLLPKGGEK